MRVHFVLPQLEPFYGMERAAVLLMRSLVAAGVPVSGSVISGAIPPDAADLDLEPINLGTRITRLAEAVPPLRRRLRALPSDVEIVSSGLWATVPVGAALAGSSRGFVAWDHSLLPERLRDDQRVRMLVRLARLGPLRPRLVVAVSEAVARTARRVLPGQVVVAIPHVVPPKAFVPPRPVTTDGTIRLVTIGAFRKVGSLKNHECAISALALLPPHYLLELAGDGEKANLLKALAADLGVTDRVTFLGRVGDVGEVLRRADVLVHPSLAETFGLSLIEAADAGVPVAALPVEAVDELVPRFVTGILAADTSPAALADAVSRLILKETPSVSDFEKTWWARRTALDPARVCGEWVEALNSRR